MDVFVIIQIITDTMKHQFDYDQNNMNQHTPSIVIPNHKPKSTTTLFPNNHSKHINTKPTSIAQRASLILFKKQEKIKQMKMLQMTKASKQCTFKPKTISKKGQKRTLDEFLTEQDDFKRKVENKCKNIKFNIQQKEKNDSFFQPKINKKSKEMPHRPEQQENSVFQRLYTLQDKENINTNIQSLEFQPHINPKSKNMVRTAAIQNLLYDDAIRRRSKLKESSLTPRKSQRSMSITNQRYAANRFIKEYCSMLERININSCQNAEISYVVFVSLLRLLNFVRREEKQDNQQRALVLQAYQLIEAYSPNVRNACVFLLALLGIFNVDPINFQSAEGEGQLQIDQIEGREIQTYFQCLKINRFSTSTPNKSPAQQNKQQTFSFHPKINKTSSELAQKHRTQMLQEASILIRKYPELQKGLPKNGKITNTDLLVLKEMVKELRIKKQQQINQKQNLSQCTFKPSTNNLLDNNQSTGLGQKKSLQLYNEHKDRIAYRQYLHSNKVDKEEEEAKHCTFSPNINPFKLQSSQINMKHSALFTQNPRNNNNEHNLMTSSHLSKRRVITQPYEDPSVMDQFTVAIRFGEEMQCVNLKVGDFGHMDATVVILNDKYQLQMLQGVKLHQLLRKQMQRAIYNNQNAQRISYN